MIGSSHITPPTELVQQWEEQFLERPTINGCFIQSYIAAKAAQWGADQELEACCEWLDERAVLNGATALRTARRPKPPSLKEQALEALQFVDEKLDLPLHNHCNAIHTIRRALEALDD
jgi:hypothetical protein